MKSRPLQAIVVVVILCVTSCVTATLDIEFSVLSLDPVTAHLGHEPKPIAALPGFTRSVVSREYALITPESRVSGPHPGWVNTNAVVYVSPAMGARFLQFVATVGPNGGTSGPTDLTGGPSVERFLYVLSGSLSLHFGRSSTAVYANESSLAGPGAFAYVPPNTPYELSATQGRATLLVVERVYAAVDGLAPAVVVGQEGSIAPYRVPGEFFLLKKLLPTTAAYDFNMHWMSFEPGEFLAVKEVHYHEHGLLLLEGQGLYRLADDWFPVTAGDVIWMGPYVPQWYAALGKTRSVYLIYKDVNRSALTQR
mmetsp:Transcript_3633/g.6364  ORF Transcript_3633/g.6364 Transcript_3633/m.6364 type:complete len:309 (+) Transcript_3633:40-966(+)|eukprot:CAMPEP_0196652946 /NCGR_PEP_ID=MMETSP1086-20130531/2465_1 /TAXON_ID=77921 /ORGANISM="Cyanoptyche  gloeocystis , Strain SAG4.97" /LENGTH=308 /DNA_ID=CAMNT_0041983823 /DNA_START=40 /DNA_END=966 /DNA_ORIENTATION=-